MGNNLPVPCQNAMSVLDAAEASVASFFAAFEVIRAGKGRGTTTDEEQDVLRAALVFSGAGLDSAVKHLIRDSLDELSGGDDQVRDEFAKFVERKIGGSEDGAPLNAKLIARSLIGKEPRSILLKEYIAAMTGESLQSVSQLCKVCACLGVSDENVIKDKSQLKRIFVARNKIVHELDVDLGQKRAKPCVAMMVWTPPAYNLV